MLKRARPVATCINCFRNCSLAVLLRQLTDNSKELLSRFENFDINVLRRERGVASVINPPEDAFVDGRIIRALQANLFAVLRDILFIEVGRIHMPVVSSIWILKAQHISPIWCSLFCATPGRCTSAKRQTWWYAGAATQLTKQYLYACRASARSWSYAS